MTFRLTPPPADLTSFLGRKWLESLVRDIENLIIQAGLNVPPITELPLVLADTEPTLTSARTLQAGSGITVTDGGAGAGLTIAEADSGVTPGVFTKLTVNAKGISTLGELATTSDIAEGTNLYYTAARVSALATQDMLFDYFADVGNGTTVETDLVSSTLAAGQLSANGQKIFAQYSGYLIGHATATRQLRIYFGGTAIFDTGAAAVPTSVFWNLKVLLIRVSATVIRYSINYELSGGVNSVTVGELTGLTLSNTNVLKVTGQAAGVGAATNDLVARMGTVEWRAAA